MRGYAAVGLDNPKNPINIGHVLRAAGCYKSELVVIGGPRPQRLKSCSTDPQKNYRHLPTVMVDDVFDAIPYDCVPVAVDLVDEAESLIDFKHPERAFYIFGAEDATLGERILGRCAQTVYVPTSNCMNLSACVNVVLYDRLVKRAA